MPRWSVFELLSNEVNKIAVRDGQCGYAIKWYRDEKEAEG